MLAAERRSKLVDLVHSTGAMSTEDLAAELSVSVETIRRDLLTLEQRGVIARVHGGATKRSQSVVASEPSFDVRSGEGLERKQRIATAAAALVSDGTLVMIDVGTTALLAARALPVGLDATVVTTSIRVAVELSDRPGIDLIVAGGRMRGGDLALSGMSTSDVMRDMHFDVALLGSGGVHPEAGLTDFHLEEARTRREIIANSSHSYVLCDATKFDTIARYRVVPLGGFSGLIVDEQPTGDLMAALRRSGTEVVAAR